MLLRDSEIQDLLKGESPIVKDFPGGAHVIDDYSANSRVQSASLDLSVGNIYVPEAAKDELGGTDSPIANYVLEPGHTVVVETHETLDLPSDIAAIGFPPSHVSARGLLTTNPGHVDAGYKGRLSFTIINMGRKSFEIRQGDGILTLLLFKMPSPVRADYSARLGQRPAVSEDRMSRLSQDFLQVQERAEKVAKNEESRTRRWSIIVPLILAAVVAAGSIVTTYLQNHSALAEKVQRQETELAVLKQQLAQKDLEERVARLERRR